MEFHKIIQIPEWNESIKQKIIAFWQKRDIVFAETQSDILKGQRGSIWGNFVSYDMSKLIATVTVSRTSPTEILCILNVNTVFQIVTEWNKAYWQLELDTLESWLLHDDNKEAEWQELLKGVRKTAIQWTATLGIAGYKLSPKMEATLAQHKGNRILLRAAEASPESELLRPSADLGNVSPQELLRSSDKQE